MLDVLTDKETSIQKEYWKVLIVDDEPEVHRMTKMVLSDFEFENYPLHLLSAFSGKEAYLMLQQHPDICLILLDVVMETDQAGLDLVKKIREELHNTNVRIILRTGQPGQAPEQKVVLEYDINDYKEKTELTVAKLFTTILSSLRAYRDICNLEKQKQEIDRRSRLNAFILKVMPCETLLIKRDGSIIFCGHPFRKSDLHEHWQCKKLHDACSLECSWIKMKLPLNSLNSLRWETNVGSVPYEVSFFPVEENLCLAYAFDITEKKKHEEVKSVLSQQLMHAEKMESIGLLASSMAHDFNNHLTGIFGCVQMIRNMSKENSSEFQYCNLIQESATKASKLVKKLLIFSRQEKGVFVQVDFHQLIADTIDLLRPRFKKIALEFHKNTPQVFIKGDVDQLQNSLINMAFNAYDAMPDGGKLIFETSSFQPDDSSDQVFYLKLRVSDSGTGMTDEVKKRLFEPFFTTKGREKGTGLGLASVYGCIKNHHGTITVESAVNAGTTFTILLPILSNADIDALATPGLVRYGTIYIAEPDPLLSSLETHFLTDMGHTVKLFDTGTKLIDYVAQNTREKVNLFLLNLHWPDKDSAEIFETLQKIIPDPKGIFIYQATEYDRIIQRCGSGIAGMLQNAFTKDIFYDVVSRALAKTK